ncbi:MAG: NADH-quinone oxidoreductase subunit M [Candidatus Riflebacteria bacterium]|nr:NADH-quinone oxidoreductase subunit M [Candidatus Riflebacteria bacterium]
METLLAHLLTVLILLPVLGSLVIAYLPGTRPRLIWRAALVVSMAELLVSLALIQFQPVGGAASLQLTERCDWIPAWGIQYLVGVDGFSIYLILLTTLLTPIVLLASQRSIRSHIKAFTICFLVLETGIVGSLSSLDLFLFYLFWEIMLLPMFLIIGVWGGPSRIYAAVKFILYTMIGSLLMLVAILYLAHRHWTLSQPQVWTFNVLELYNTPLEPTEQLWLFAAFALAFAIKVPLFPFHTWLPDAHTEAPTGGSVILAAVLLKLGGYGFLRFALPLFPAAAAAFAPLLMLLGVTGILYGALVSWKQEDMKRLVAFSSVSHLGFAMLGIASATVAGIQGAMFVMLAHGLSTGGLFLLVGMLYERRHTRMMEDYGGLMAVVPNMSWVLRLLTFASVGLPGLCGFVGEFLVLLGASQNEGWGRPAAVVAAFGMIVSALYMLHMFGRVMHGEVVHQENRTLADMDLYEFGYLSPVLILVFVLGLFPGWILPRVGTAAERVVECVGTARRYRLEAMDSHGNFVYSMPVRLYESVPDLRQGGER